ncbi:MAG: TetR/AcrR family transcriptional regulator [Gemmobacter sp.]|jgi:AcrR family transcriptional regulator|nr:TetR/AcrR family transcriptional regulator [Gemmobacter sp.]
MARRSDHTRAELEELILAEGHALMAQTGYARFSAREVAKRIGYSIGTIYNVFGSLDRLLMRVNSRTFTLWTDTMRERLDAGAPDRIRVLVEGYFGFATANPNLWMAIYDHRIAPGEALPERYQAQRAELIGIIEAEIRRTLPAAHADRATPLARSLVATVHGHCMFALTGTFALLGETDPQGAALARVRESLAAAGG